MISLADKLISCGASKPVSPSSIVAYSNALPTWGLAIDRVGSVTAIAGGYDDTLDALFVASVGETGAINWQRKLTSANSLNITSVAVDGSGNVYALAFAVVVVGETVLLKYNSSGTLQWQRAISKAAVGVSGTALKLSSDGNLYLTVSHTAGSYVGYTLLKYNSSGALQWQRQCSYASATIYARGITEGVDGNIYLVCSQTGTTIRKYNNAGAFLAYAMITGPSSPSDIVADASGNFYVAVVVPVNKGGIIKLNSSLVVQWAKKFDTGIDYLGGLKALASGNIAYASYLPAGGYGEFTTAGAVAKQRSLVVSSLVAVTFGVSDSADGKLLFAARGKINGTKYEALLGIMDTSGDTGTYGTVNVVTETTHTVSDATNATSTETWTEAAGTLTDAAGSLTDSVGALTATTYNKDY